MLKLAAQAMLLGTMGFAWDTIKTGESLVAYSETRTEERVGFLEWMAWRGGHTALRAGERLELGVNRLALLLGYGDGVRLGCLARSG